MVLECLEDALTWVLLPWQIYIWLIYKEAIQRDVKVDEAEFAKKFEASRYQVRIAIRHLVEAGAIVVKTPLGQDARAVRYSFRASKDHAYVSKARSFIDSVDAPDEDPAPRTVVPGRK